MPATPALENLLRHDRLIVAAMLGSIVLPAWGYMAYEAQAMYHSGASCCAGMAMAGPDANPWSAATLPPLFLMWAEMMVAMMIPSAAPMILTFAMVNRKRREQQRPFVPTLIFLSGYLAVWAGFSALAAVAQWILHTRALLSPLMTSTSPVLGGILLLGAGLFQWTPWKAACLGRCRSPLAFLMTDWREGRWGAVVMGLKHGVFCTGCCWLLMVLLFVAGVMNLWWIAILTVFVLLEKVAPSAWQIGKAAGVLLALWGIWLLTQPL